MKKIILILILSVSALVFMAAQKSKLLKEASFYNKLKNNLVRCTLCPNDCILSEGQTGICKVRKNIEGKLYSLVYNRPISINIDPIEKKPLYHFYPGSNILSIATVGCNMRCNFCQNWEISQSRPNEVHAYDLSSEEIIDLAKKYNCKSIAFTYTEPTIFYEYMIDIAKLAQKNNIKTVMVTCGFINEKPFRQLCKFLDAANIDLKGFSEEFYSTYTTASLQPVLNTLKIAKEEGLYFEITNLVIPDANDDIEMIENMCNWIADSLGRNYPLHYSRFFPKYKLLNQPPTPRQTLLKAKKIAESEGIKYVYIGNVSTQWEDTFCSNCNKKIIDRSGYKIESFKLNNGKCAFCGEEIFGRWDNIPQKN